MSAVKLFVNAWLKGELASAMEEFEGLSNGIAASGTVRIPPDNIPQLIAWLQDEENVGQYGAELELVLFYDPDTGKRPNITGNIKPKDPNNDRARKGQGQSTLKAKRQVL